MTATAAGEQRSSGRLGVQLFFEKRTKNGTEVILKKGRCVRSFADRIRQKFNLSTSFATFFVALVGCSAILIRAEGI